MVSFFLSGGTPPPPHPTGGGGAKSSPKPCLKPYFFAARLRRAAIHHYYHALAPSGALLRSCPKVLPVFSGQARMRRICALPIALPMGSTMRISLGRRFNGLDRPLCTTDSFPNTLYYVSFSGQARDQARLSVLPIALPIGSTMRLSLNLAWRGMSL